jgi:hypothetical protein
MFFSLPLGWAIIAESRTRQSVTGFIVTADRETRIPYLGLYYIWLVSRYITPYRNLGTPYSRLGPPYGIFLIRCTAEPPS